MAFGNMEEKDKIGMSDCRVMMIWFMMGLIGEEELIKPSSDR